MTSMKGEDIWPEYIELVDVKKYYQMGEIKIKALDGINFTIKKGEFVDKLDTSKVDNNLYPVERIE